MTEESTEIQLLAGLVPEGVKPGTMLLVEFDPDSQWLSVATTITSHFFRKNHHVGYLAMVRPVEEIERWLTQLGVDFAPAIQNGRFVIEDWYSATLSGGRLDSLNEKGPIFERTPSGLRVRSLKVSDLSVEWLKASKAGPQIYDVIDNWPAGSLVIAESFSGMLRFNEEKPFAEWIESRVNPGERKRKGVTIQGLVRGLHSDWLYKRMESASDGIIDIRVMERGEEAKNLLRLRTLKGQPHDTRWHELQIKSNGEATLST